MLRKWMLKIFAALPEPADHVVDLAPGSCSISATVPRAEVEPVIRTGRDVDEPLQALDQYEDAGDAMQPRRGVAGSCG